MSSKSLRDSGAIIILVVVLPMLVGAAYLGYYIGGSSNNTQAEIDALNARLTTVEDELVDLSSLQEEFESAPEEPYYWYDETEADDQWLSSGYSGDMEAMIGWLMMSTIWSEMAQQGPAYYPGYNCDYGCQPIDPYSDCCYSGDSPYYEGYSDWSLHPDNVWQQMVYSILEEFLWDYTYPDLGLEEQDTAILIVDSGLVPVGDVVQDDPLVRYPITGFVDVYCYDREINAGSIELWLSAESVMAGDPMLISDHSTDNANDTDANGAYARCLEAEEAPMVTATLQTGSLITMLCWRSAVTWMTFMTTVWRSGLILISYHCRRLSVTHCLCRPLAPATTTRIKIEWWFGGPVRRNSDGATTILLCFTS